MPLYIYERDQTNQIRRNPDKSFKTIPLELKNEMRARDFAVPPEMTAKMGLKHSWLHANFVLQKLWTPEGRDFDECKKELAAFLNSKMKGAYYVNCSIINKKHKLEITLTEAEDIKKFREHFKDWEHQETAADLNAQTKQKWAEAGHRP
jgi:hypothetical protein